MCAKEPTELPLAVRHGCMATSSPSRRDNETPERNRSSKQVCLPSSHDRPCQLERNRSSKKASLPSWNILKGDNYEFDSMRRQ